MKATLHRWLVRPIVQQLTQGVTTPKIAQAVSWGVTLGIFPIIGSNTLLTRMVGVPMKLNQPVLQAFKTISYPLQWSLLLVFYRAGEWLFNAPHVSIHIPTMPIPRKVAISASGEGIMRASTKSSAPIAA